MKQKTTLITFLFVLCTLFASAQTKTVTGKVTDAAGQPLVGITVLVKGSTTLGTTTNVDGTYELKNVPANAILNFSSIGMKSDESSVQGRTMVDVAMDEDALNLEDVVVVGYGTAKLKDLTSPISSVKAEEIVKTASNNAMQAIQGKVAGVQIISNGEPGSGPSVRIRGVGSFKESAPLYVVDGMFYNNIDFLNNNDIESISFLKDASAAAIYGVRAANGVVLVSTRKGALNQKAVVSYSGYVGVQRATNLLNLANTAQYTQMMTEAGQLNNINASIAAWGGENGRPATDTDWYKELLRTGVIQNHSVDVTGGSETASYSVGVNYIKQTGIMKARSDYERVNVRAKGDYQPFKWLKLGANVIISTSTKDQASTDAFFKAFIMPSIVPAYDQNNVNAYPIRYGDPKQAGFDNGYFGNPVAIANTTGGTTKTFNTNILPSYYAEIGILGNNKLTLRSSFSQELAMNRSQSLTPEYLISSSSKNESSDLTKKMNYYSNFIWDNTLTYNDSFGKHNLTAMLGQSMRQESARGLEASAENVPYGEPEYIYVNKGDAASRKGTDSGSTYRGASFFARATYNYDSKYLLSATMRADGTSKYQEKWGYFPSVGVAWNISNENFMKSQKVFDYLKIRASWGKLGNDKIAASNGQTVISSGYDQSSAMGEVLYPGYINGLTFSYLSWEVVEETNVGFEAAFLNSRLTLDADYYVRNTQNAVISAPAPMTGTGSDRNYGKITNSGIEVTLNWSDKIGKDFRYNVGFNMSTLKNEVKSLGEGVPYILGGSAEFRNITTIGQAIDTYYGYKVAGVYQNAAEIAADPIAVSNNLQPGDLKYEDKDGNHILDDKDRQYLGSALPTFTYGGNIGLEWKNLDFSLSFMGVSGNKIVNQKNGVRRWVSSMNYDEKTFKNRWTGEGSTNKYPSAAGMFRSWNISNFSDFLVESGSFFRLQNVQLGYTFQNIAPKGSKGAKLRLYVSADRPLTSFSYNGYTPEVSNGYDTNTYPMAAIYSFGIKITY